MSENLHKRRSSIGTRGFGVSAAEKQIFKLQALSKGKRVMETRPNPNTAETNNPFIRVQIGRNAK